MIAKMTKMTFLGPKEEKERFLKRLQEVGITHLILPPEAQEPGDIKRELQRISGARRFLAKQIPAAGSGTPDQDQSEICGRLEELKNKQSKLEVDLAAGRKELARSRIWEDFNPEDVEYLRTHGVDVKFYRLSPKVFEDLDKDQAFFAPIWRSEGEVATVVFATEPFKLDYPEEKDPRPPARLTAELENLQAELEEIKKEYSKLADGLEVLAKAELDFQNDLEYERALRNLDMALEDRIYLVRCWSPLPEGELLESIGSGFTLYHMAEQAEEGDRIPVLLVNSKRLSPGEDLVKVYSHPNQNDFDPSGLVMWWFALFFGMIIGDFGYGLVLLLITAFIHRMVKNRSEGLMRFLRLSYILSASVMIFGVLGASYMGLPMGENNPLMKLMLLDFSTPEGQNHVMLVAILIGMVHITLSLAIKLFRQRDLPSLGWILVTWGGYFVIKSMDLPGGIPMAAKVVLIAGLALVVLFTSSSRNPLIRLLAGLNGTLGAIQLFSDVLSYLRLFALGLATAYMMQTFNTLAGMAKDAIPYLGIVMAVFILLVGHTINLVLGIMGGVIHGLRLNFLEWYRWSFEGDGLPFKPFKKIVQ
jgi:V/A-type H+-transporting ATPase subunit I